MLTNCLLVTSKSQIITTMADETTDELNSKRPFEARVFARFDALKPSLRVTDSRIQESKISAYDAKAIAEQVLKEIVETRRDLSNRLDRIEAIAHETRSARCRRSPG